jgi:hypothetical protein
VVLSNGKGSILRRCSPRWHGWSQSDSLALAVAKDWRVHHLDVKSALLNGELMETVFVKQALGFTKKGAEHKVLRLRKAL